METAILNFGRAYLYAIGGKTNRKIKWLWPYSETKSEVNENLPIHFWWSWDAHYEKGRTKGFLLPNVLSEIENIQSQRRRTDGCYHTYNLPESQSLMKRNLQLITSKSNFVRKVACHLDIYLNQCKEAEFAGIIVIWFSGAQQRQSSTNKLQMELTHRGMIYEPSQPHQRICKRQGLPD